MDGKPHDSLIEGWWREEGIIQAPDYVCVCVWLKTPSGQKRWPL